MQNIVRVDVNDSSSSTFELELGNAQQQTVVPTFSPKAGTKPMQMDNETLQRLHSIDHRLDFNDSTSTAQSENPMTTAERQERFTKSLNDTTIDPPLQQHAKLQQSSMISEKFAVSCNASDLFVDARLVNSWLQSLAHGTRNPVSIGYECLTVTGHEFRESTKFASSELQFVSESLANIAIPNAQLILEAVRQCEERHRHIHNLFTVQHQVLQVVIDRYGADHTQLKSISEASQIKRIVEENHILQDKIGQYMGTIDKLQKEVKEILDFEKQVENSPGKKHRMKKNKAKASGVDVQLLELYEDMILHASVDDYEIIHGDSLVLRANHRKSTSRRSTSLRAHGATEAPTESSNRPSNAKEMLSRNRSQRLGIMPGVNEGDEAKQMGNKEGDRLAQTATGSEAIPTSPEKGLAPTEGDVGYSDTQSEGPSRRNTFLSRSMYEDVLDSASIADVLGLLGRVTEDADVYEKASMVTQAFGECEKATTDEVARQLDGRQRALLLGSLIGGVKSGDFEAVAAEVLSSCTTSKDILSLLGHLMSGLSPELLKSVLFDGLVEFVNCPAQLEDLYECVNEIEVKVLGPGNEIERTTATSTASAAGVPPVATQKDPEEAPTQQVTDQAPRKLCFVSDFADDLEAIHSCREMLEGFKQEHPESHAFGPPVPLEQGSGSVLDSLRMPKEWKRSLGNRRKLRRRKSSRTGYHEIADHVTSNLLGKIYAKHAAMAKYYFSSLANSGMAAVLWDSCDPKRFPKLSRAAVQFCLEEYGIATMTAEHLGSVWGILRTYYHSSKRVFQFTLCLGSIGASVFSPLLSMFHTTLLSHCLGNSHYEQLFAHGEGCSYMTKVQAMNALHSVLVAVEKGSAATQLDPEATERLDWNWPLDNKLWHVLLREVDKLVVTRKTALAELANAGKADPAQILMKPGPGGSDEELIQVDDLLSCAMDTFLEKLTFDKKLVEMVYHTRCAKLSSKGPLTTAQVHQLLCDMQPNFCPSSDQTAEFCAVVYDSVSLQDADEVEDNLQSFKGPNSNKAFATTLAILYAARGAVRDYSTILSPENELLTTEQIEAIPKILDESIF